jgi:hypothetical protein
LTQEWPSNDNALGGAIFEVMNFIFASTGTCYIRLPVAVYWFHVFNAHIDPTESDPSSGTYALIAANQAFEGVSTLDFIVNYIGDDYRFNAEDIELSCDSTNTWTTSLLSFPGNTNGNFTSQKNSILFLKISKIQFLTFNKIFNKFELKKQAKI